MTRSHADPIRRFARLARFALLSLALVTGARAERTEKDPVVAPRFPGAKMTSYSLNPDPDVNAILHVKEGGEVGVQGRIVNLDYELADKKVTQANVLNHYRAAFGKAGGTLLFDGELYGWRYVTARFTKGIDETWVELRVGPPEGDAGAQVSMTTVETQIESERPEQSPEKLEKRLGRMTVLIARIEWEPTGAIKPSSVRHVRAIARFLKDRPDWKLTLAVHSPDPKDKEVVAQRSAAVRSYFKKEGLDARVTVAGIVDESPLFGSEKEPQGRQQNRALTVARAF